MTDESLAAEGIHASASPVLPSHHGSTLPATVSLAEESSMGIPTGSIAQPEVHPLTGVARNGYTSTSTKHSEDLPGIGQQCLAATQNLASAAASQLQSPENQSLLRDSGEKDEAPGTLEQPTASTPIDERSSVTERSERPMMGWSPFSPTGPQSTHGSSVGMGSPYLLPVEGAVAPDRSGGRATPRQGSSSPAPGSRLAIAQATRESFRARSAAVRSPVGCLQGAWGSKG